MSSCSTFPQLLEHHIGSETSQLVASWVLTIVQGAFSVPYLMLPYAHTILTTSHVCPNDTSLLLYAVHCCPGVRVHHPNGAGQLGSLFVATTACWVFEVVVTGSGVGVTSAESSITCSTSS